MRNPRRYLVTCHSAAVPVARRSIAQRLRSGKDQFAAAVAAHTQSVPVSRPRLRLGRFGACLSDFVRLSSFQQAMFEQTFGACCNNGFTSLFQFVLRFVSVVSIASKLQTPLPHSANARTLNSLSQWPNANKYH